MNTTKHLVVSHIASLSLLLLFLVASGSSQADVRMPAILGSHIVLEQDIKIPVWGWADAGEAVTVVLGNKTAKTTADVNGEVGDTL